MHMVIAITGILQLLLHDVYQYFSDSHVHFRHSSSTVLRSVCLSSGREMLFVVG